MWIDCTKWAICTQICTLLYFAKYSHPKYFIKYRKPQKDPWKGQLSRGNLMEMFREKLSTDNCPRQKFVGTCPNRNFMRGSCLGDSCPGWYYSGKNLRGKSPEDSWPWEISWGAIVCGVTVQGGLFWGNCWEGTKSQGGNCPGWSLMGGNYPGESCPGENYSGVIVQSDKILEVNCPRGNFIGGNCPGDSCPGKRDF